MTRIRSGVFGKWNYYYGPALEEVPTYLQATYS